MTKVDERISTIEQAVQVPPSSGTAVLQAYRHLGIKCLLLGLIGGIFIFRFPLPVLAALAVCIVIVGAMVWQRRAHPIGGLIVVNYLLWCVSGLLTGAMVMSSAISPAFWRGEGRCFLFYLPLLAFSFLQVRRDELRFAVRIVCVLTIAGGVLGVAWLAGLGHLFQSEVDPETGQQATSLYFIGLLTSHTGAGAFWGTAAAFLFGYSFQIRDKRIQALAILAATLTLATGGRAATLGLLAAIGWLCLRGVLLSRRNLVLATATVCLAVAGAVFVGSRVPEISERMSELTSPRSLASVRAASQETSLKDASGYFYSGANLEYHNLVVRVYLWKYALQLTKTSPLIGVGFGRYNDSYPEFRGIKHVAWLMVDGERNYGSGIQWEREQLMVSTGNAHNSYLHVLAETGLIGLVLFALLWWHIFRVCHTLPTDAEGPHPFDSAYAVGCQAMVVCLLVAALAGHALGAPTGGVLLTTLVGAWVAYQRQIDSGHALVS